MFEAVMKRKERKKKLLLAFVKKKMCLAFEMCIVILCQGFIPTRVLTDVRPRDVLKSDVMALGSSEPLSAAGRGQGRVQTCPEIVTTQREECPGIYLCFPSFFPKCPTLEYPVHSAHLSNFFLLLPLHL